ncbi:MAG TPA: hypothetical protein VG944_09200, partial [Fimbriimonas sp.]|nr:hypothetical protein [Fimbriimonas sp.]
MSKKALKTVEPVALPAHLSRRQLLAGTSGGILALTGLGVSLIGCGGGGGGSRSSGGGSISLASGSGSVTLPAGIQASALKAGCGITDSPITAGKFSIKAPGDAPSLITVYNPTNRKAVLFGMYDPSASASSMVDATSTAVALLFMSLGGANYTRDGIKPLLEAINTSAAVAPLASTISSQMATDPYALANGNSAISSALSSAATSLASLIVLPKEVMQPKDAPDLQLINPSDAVDGLTMAALDAGTGFKVINQWRRFMKAYVYTSKHWDTENVERDVSPPSYTAGPLNVSPASSLLNVSGGWAPSYSSDVSLPVQPKDNKTEYKIVSLQPVYGAIEPAFFSDQQWTNEVIRWRQDLSELGGSTFVAFFANVLFSAIGLGALTWTLGELTAAYSSLTALPSFAQVLSIASARSVALGTTARSALNLFVTNDTVGAGVLKALAPLLKEATAVQDAILAGGASEAAIFARMAACLGVVLAGGALALAADIGAVIKDTSTGQEADMWTATVLHQTMRLTPQSPKVGPGEVVTFSVRIPTGTTGTIVFDWFQDSAYAALRSSSGVTGTTLTHIRDLVVDLATTGSDSKPVH